MDKSNCDRLISGPSSRRKTPPEENESTEIKEITADSSAPKSENNNGASVSVKPVKSSLDDMFGIETVRYCGFCAKIFVGQEAHSKHLAESHPGFYQL